MKIVPSTFNEILPVWRDHLWPGRTSPLREHSSMRLEGGFDPDIYKNEVYFYKIVVDDVLAGTNSVFKTGDGEFRSRGLYVFPEFRGRSLSRTLLEEAIAYTERQGGKVLWSLPRVRALPAYESVGFKKLRAAQDQDMEFGPNVYAALRLSSLR